MNPAPPVTSSFTRASSPRRPCRRSPRASGPRHRWRAGREVDVGEIEDTAEDFAEIAHAVSDAGWNHEQPRGAVAEDDAPAHTLGRRALADVEQHDEHPIRRR